MVTTITLWKVPEGVRDQLVTRAERSGRTLQEFLLAELEDLAARSVTDDPYPADPIHGAGRGAERDLGHDFARDMTARARSRSRGRRLTAIDVLFEGAPEPRRDSS